LRVSHGARGGTTVTATLPLAQESSPEQPELAGAAT
jgi:hypothetical protein